MKNSLTTTNQNTKLALTKAKSLLDITNKLLSKKDIMKNFALQLNVNNLYLRSKSSNISLNESILIIGTIGVINLIDLKNGEMIKTFYGHQNEITNVALSPDNKILVSVSKNEVKVWDTFTSKCIKTLNINCYWAESCIRFIDNEILVAYQNENYMIEILSLYSGNMIKIPNHNYACSINLSKDGKYLMNSHYDDDNDGSDWNSHGQHTIVVWDINNIKPINTIKNSSYRYFTHITHMNSKYFIATKSSRHGNHGLLIYNIFNDEIRNIDLCYEDIAVIDVSIDDKYLLACEKDTFNTTIHLINLENLEVISRWEIKDTVEDIRFVNNDSDFIILTFGSMQYVTFNNIKQKNITWNHMYGYQGDLKLNDKELKYKLNANTNTISCAAISNDLKTIASCSGNKIKLWDFTNGKLLKSLVVEAEYPTRVHIRSINYSVDNSSITINVLRGDPYKENDYYDSNYDLKKFGIIKNKSDIKKHMYSLKVVNDMIKVYKDQEEIYTIYNFFVDEFVTIKPNGYFYSSVEAVDKYIRISETPLSQRKLTTEEIKYFKKNNLLEAK